MIEQVVPGVFRIRIPLPNNPLKELNSWVVRDGGRSLIIDTGFNRTACFEAMQAGLAELGVDLTNADFMLTHLHSDHTGLVSRLAAPGARIYMGRVEARFFGGGIDWRRVMSFAIANGFDPDELKDALTAHPGIKYKPENVPELTLVDDGDVITVGDWHLRCVVTPGHTWGHTCLYEPDRKVLFSGDHVLWDITPHIESWSWEDNALKDFIQSLLKIRDLPVDIVLPGHRNTFTDLRGRVEALMAHHETRSMEAIGVLEGGALSAYDTAARMTWDIRAANWQEFPITQKWFATGETLAHLLYLESQGRVRRNTDATVNTFEINR